MTKVDLQLLVRSVIAETGVNIETTDGRNPASQSNQPLQEGLSLQQGDIAIVRDAIQQYLLQEIVDRWSWRSGMGGTQ